VACVLVFLAPRASVAVARVVAQRPAMPITAAAGPRSRRAWTVPSSAASVRELLKHTREINYYPASAAWSEMWTDWNLSAIAADLARMHEMGANTVRIFLQPTTIGYPQPSTTMLGRLTQFFDAAAGNGLRVHLTLFDFWDQFGDLSNSENWARAVVSPFAGNPALATVELKNEIDQADRHAMAWARTLVPFVRSIAGVPVTISVSGATGVRGLMQLKKALGPDQPDFYSFHYYGNAGLSRTTLRDAAAVASPSPLFVGEFGAPSNDSLGTAAGDARQDLYIRSVAAAAKCLDLSYPAPWTLNDLTQGAIPTPTLANDPTQYAMGLLNANGTTKPAGASIQQLFTHGAVDPGFDGGFEAGFAARSATGSLPLEWSVFDPAQARFGRDTTVAHAGDASARISDSGGSSTGVPSFYITPPDGWVVAGTTYTASVWARGLNVTGRNRMALAWFNASGVYIGEAESGDLTSGTTDWAQLMVSARAPSGAAYVQIHLKSAHNAGSVWFDDVSWSG
jgi:Cellulase (glycosyl hydrolase family 5)